MRPSDEVTVGDGEEGGGAEKISLFGGGRVLCDGLAGSVLPSCMLAVLVKS